LNWEEINWGDSFTKRLDNTLAPGLTKKQLKDKMHVMYEAHRLVEEMHDSMVGKPGADVYLPGVEEVMRHLAYELRGCQREAVRRSEEEVREEIEEESQVRSIK